MKKILLVLLFAAVAQVSIAQDFKKVKIAVGILKWEDAKTEIDKLEMALQAKIYQKNGYDKEKLESFFESAKKEIDDPQLKELFIQIINDE